MGSRALAEGFGVGFMPYVLIRSNPAIRLFAHLCRRGGFFKLRLLPSPLTQERQRWGWFRVFGVLESESFRVVGFQGLRVSGLWDFRVLRFRVLGF